MPAASAPAHRKIALPHARHERRHGGCVAGVDEAGRGPLAGPVTAAAVWLPAKLYRVGSQDSKKLSPECRETLHATLLAGAKIGIGMASVQEIDAINILQASMLAMQRALEALAEAMGAWPALALIDGNRVPKMLPCSAQSIIGGDGISVSIAAASIVAKVTRDRLMRELHQEHPHYGWDRNAGYGTPAHHAGLRSHGACAHHRRTFAPIRALAERDAGVYPGHAAAAVEAA